MCILPGYGRKSDWFHRERVFISILWYPSLWIMVALVVALRNISGRRAGRPPGSTTQIPGLALRVLGSPSEGTQKVGEGRNSAAPISVSCCPGEDLWAGAEVQLKVLLSKLVLRPEFNLSVILFNGGRLGKEIEELGIPVAVFPEAEWGSGKMFLQLVRTFKQSDAKIVHTHKYKDTILAAPAAKLCGIPYVVRTVHGLREPFEGLQAFKMSLYESIERTVHRCCVNSIIGVSSQIERKIQG
ncbi:MAG: glycosyltransferase [Nitrospira sp.]|nr:glycosyltransferase [Nitrospira sp.]